MTIQWFPGHMAKARREISERIGAVDMVIELRDARIPEASRNPLLDELIGDKPRLIILTKQDKADADMTERWLKYLNDRTIALAMDLSHERIDRQITEACLTLMKAKRERWIRKGINPRAVRALVVGIPNVGKSTLINRLAKRKAAPTADRPGVTKALKLITVNRDLQLIDTPGVLWPKFTDETTGIYLALTGAIRDEVFADETVAVFALKRLIADYPDRLSQRYDITVDNDPYLVMDRIAQQRGLTTKNGAERKRTAAMLIREIRDDDLGRITWENCHE